LGLRGGVHTAADSDQGTRKKLEQQQKCFENADNIACADLRLLPLTMTCPWLTMICETETARQ
jgi:hypothetical protein